MYQPKLIAAPSIQIHGTCLSCDAECDLVMVIKTACTNKLLVHMYVEGVGFTLVFGEGPFISWTCHIIICAHIHIPISVAGNLLVYYESY